MMVLTKMAGRKLEDVFIDGKLLRDQSLQEIRAILDSEREVWQDEGN